MLDLNKIYCCDVLEGLRQLDDNSVDLIITSPPYNKRGFNKYAPSRDSKDKWNKAIIYGGDPNLDNMDEDTYESWQVEFLNECFRVLKEDGSMFYNHKNRVKKNQISSPYEWIVRSDFICRQEIIWDRGSSLNVDPCRYNPSTEKIYWLIKRHKNPRFKLLKDSLARTEVWRFNPAAGNKHPAPFPIELPLNIIPNVAQGERITVLDPFMGSGTVALAARECGCDYIGFDKFPEYVDMANKRLAETFF